MKRFLLFGGSGHGRDGGILDLIGQYALWDEANSAAHHRPGLVWAHIVDTTDGVVWAYNYDPEVPFTPRRYRL